MASIFNSQHATPPLSLPDGYSLETGDLEYDQDIFDLNQDDSLELDELNLFDFNDDDTISEQELSTFDLDDDKEIKKSEIVDSLDINNDGKVQSIEIRTAQLGFEEAGTLMDRELGPTLQGAAFANLDLNGKNAGDGIDDDLEALIDETIALYGEQGKEMIQNIYDNFKNAYGEDDILTASEFKKGMYTIAGASGEASVFDLTSKSSDEAFYTAQEKTTNTVFGTASDESGTAMSWLSDIVTDGSQTITALPPSTPDGAPDGAPDINNDGLTQLYEGIALKLDSMDIQLSALIQEYGEQGKAVLDFITANFKNSISNNDQLSDGELLQGIMTIAGASGETSLFDLTGSSSREAHETALLKAINVVFGTAPNESGTAPDESGTAMSWLSTIAAPTNDEA